MTTLTLTSFSQAMKDAFPLPGERIKQWVVDMRRESAWERETCPRFNVDPHERAGCELHQDPDCAYCAVLVRACPCGGESSLIELRDAECDICNQLYETALTSPSVIAWLAEKAARPPICEDRTKLSDEIAPGLSLAEHPLIAMLPKERK